MTDCVTVWLYGCVVVWSYGCVAVWPHDCRMRAALGGLWWLCECRGGCSAAYRGGGRGQVGRYYILLLIIYYRSLLPAAHFWLVGSYYI